MTRIFTLLAAALLISLLAFGSHGASGQAESTAAATMEGTAEAISLSNGLTLENKVSNEETAKPKIVVKVSKPVLSGATGAVVDNFNAAVDDIVKKSVTDFKTQTIQDEATATLPPEIASLGSFVQLSYEALTTTDNLISIKFTVGFYSAGAAHPNAYTVPLNYDLKAGHVLALAELFKPNANYLKTISDYSIKTLKAAGNLEFPEGATSLAENYQSYNITAGGLQINFDPYQVMPYAAGFQQVVIPYEALKAIINPDGALAQFMK
ncbi:MAG: DUF3298 domain-containing protein [Chloroflexota bacterium]